MLPETCFTKATHSQRPVLAVVVLFYLSISMLANAEVAAAAPTAEPTTTASAANSDVAQQLHAAEQTDLPEANDVSSMRHRLSQYSQRVDDLHSEFGAYDNQFAEALLNLGLTQQQLGQHDDAIKSLKQALQVNRINGGLYNPGVAPILERLIFSHAAVGDWKAVDDRHHFLMQLSLETLQPDDPALLPVISKMSRWHLYAYMENIDANPLQHLIAARGLFNRAASIIEVNFGNADLRLADQYSGRSIADYYLALHQQSESVSIGVSEEEDNFRKVVHVHNGFGAGLRAIKSSIAVYANNEEAAPEAHALALTQLGDWYLMFNKNQSAKAAYSQAYAMLAAKPEFAKIRDATFGQPVPLPDFNNAYFDYFDANEKQQKMGYVLVNVDITARGAARSAEIIDASSAQRSVRRRALMKLKTTVFRPRFESGVAIATKDLRYRYRYEVEPEKLAKKAKSHD